MMSNSGIMDEAMNTIMEDELDKAVKAVGEKLKSSEMPAEKKSCQGHRGRVRERFLASGLEGFAPHEMLELLLFYAIAYKDTKPIAHELIERFGSVAAVFDASVEELTQVKGITENAAVLFRLMPQLTKVYYAEKNKNITYNNTTLLTELFRSCFIGSSSEEFFIACFNNNLNLLNVTPISRGSGAYTSVEMRKLMAAVMKDGCTMAAIAHNHPRGVPKPSDEDIALTRRVNELLAVVDVRLMDHIIIGETQTYSMRDGGDLGIFD